MYLSITCPFCFQSFAIPGPALSEVPTDWDYDCEICCRPMLISFGSFDGEVVVEAVHPQ